MILSASRRTDIPAYYSDWFFNRIKEKYVLVRNPMNFRNVSKVSLSPDVIDCIVFWTKNPKPMFLRLDELKEYNYYFQFSLNSYKNDVEANLPSKNEIIKTFKELSEKIGAKRVIWRYDPILLNKNYSIDYHTYYFEKLASKLSGYTEKCTISFLDFYRSIKNNLRDLETFDITSSDKRVLAKNLSESALRYGMKIESCAEDIELEEFNINHAKCIDDKLIESIIGCRINAEKDKNQRPACGCVSSIDIGMYNTCLNGCKYCYANHSIKTVNKNSSSYEVSSPLLCSRLEEADIVTERKISSFK